MNPERLEQLLEFYKEDPKDPFTFYGIAMEYLKSKPQEAEKYFDLLRQEHADYLAAYYQAGSLNIALGNSEKAKKILEEGIEIAKAARDNHTLAELRSLYDEYFMEW